MNLKYIALRLARHFMPESWARFLLKRRWIIRPGLESSDPIAAVEQYLHGLATHGKTIDGQRVLVFGYGGRFAVGAELLRRGAAHVVLCDHFVLLDSERNRELLPDYAEYLMAETHDVKPHPEFLTLVHGDIRDAAVQKQIAEVDYILSTSVYEHLEDVDGVTRALANLTSATGSQLHFVDLRDHYFKRPFEMLTFSEHIWRNFLNPTSNLNRLRLTNYQQVFATYCREVDIAVLKRQEDEFQATRSRIRPEFLTGDDAKDSVTLISIFSQSPMKNQRPPA